MPTENEQQLAHQLQANKHEVFIISVDEMDAIVRSSHAGSRPNVQASWQKVRDKLNLGASYYASANDAVVLTKLVGDLGGLGAQAYVKHYGGKPHIILKGRPGLRRILTGTKYGIKNPKVVSMGLGRTGAVAAAKQGGVLSVILLTAYRVVDYFLTDNATLAQLVGRLATDVVKVGIATGASIAAASAVAAVTTVAIGPLVAVIVVGVGVSLILEYADGRLGITQRVVAALREIETDAESYVARQKQRAANAAGQAANSVVDYAVSSVRRIAVRWVQRTLREYLSPVPRLR